MHENYNAITGTGNDVTSGDRFYHSGALQGMWSGWKNGPEAGSQ